MNATLELGVKIHPAAMAYPMMSDAEYAGLLKDIEENGVATVIQFRGDSWEEAELIDGRCRLKAIRELGLDYRDYAHIVATEDMPDPVAHLRSVNLYRRHLSTSQIDELAAPSGKAIN